MKIYEKPIAEILDFNTEKIMDGGTDDGPDKSEGVEL